MSALAEDVLLLIRRRERITISEIKERFNVTTDTAETIIRFLLSFGFVEKDAGGRYYVLSKPCRKFLEELT
ncbi:MAG: HTH domain-containing protein [Nitrososphaerales archaeon]